MNQKEINDTFKLINHIKHFYFLGSLFSIILTVIPFFLVITSFVSKKITMIFLVIFCILQIIVHFRYFFHFNKNNYDIWSIVFIIFIFIVMSIILSGSLWIMYNLNHHLTIH